MHRDDQVWQESLAEVRSLDTAKPNVTRKAEARKVITRDRFFLPSTLNTPADLAQESRDSIESGSAGGDGSAGASRRKPGAPAGHSTKAPRRVIRGAKSQKQTYDVKVDWLTVVVPGMYAQELRRRVTEFFGVPNPSSGGCFQTAGCRWQGDGVLYFNPDGSGLGVLQLSGRAMQLLEELCGWRDFLGALVDLCARVTRIDIALDIFNPVHNLIQCAVDACYQGQLCGARNFREIVDNGLYGMQGRTLYLGQRGKNGSGRYGRVYDKGLEVGEYPAGAWLRWEVEFSGERASVLALLLLQCDDLRTSLVAECLGSFQFRQVTGRAEMDRRPPVGWYAALVAATSGVVSKVKVSRFPAEAESYREWIRTAVIPGLKAISLRSGIRLLDLIEREAGDIEASLGVRYTTLAEELERRGDAIEVLHSIIGKVGAA